MITFLAAVGLGGLAPLLATAGAWLGVIGGPLAGVIGLVAGKAPAGRLKLILIIVAVLIAAVALIGFTVHYEHLKNAAAEWREVAPKIAALEHDLGCENRDANERDLFECIPARDRDIEAAKAAALKEQQLQMARALDAEQKRADDAEADLDFANGLINSAGAADDGPLPKVMRDNWARERTRRGVK